MCADQSVHLEFRCSTSAVSAGSLISFIFCVRLVYVFYLLMILMTMVVVLGELTNARVMLDVAYNGAGSLDG